MVWAFNSLSASFGQNAQLSVLLPNWLMALGISFVYLLVTFFMSKRVQDMIRVTGELSSV
jgi:hypothetical protein